MQMQTSFLGFAYFLNGTKQRILKLTHWYINQYLICIPFQFYANPFAVHWISSTNLNIMAKKKIQSTVKKLGWFPPGKLNRKTSTMIIWSYLQQFCPVATHPKFSVGQICWEKLFAFFNPKNLVSNWQSSTIKHVGMEEIRCLNSICLELSQPQRVYHQNFWSIIIYVPKNVFILFSTIDRKFQKPTCSKFCH